MRRILQLNHVDIENRAFNPKRRPLLDKRNIKTLWGYIREILDNLTKMANNFVTPKNIFKWIILWHFTRSSIEYSRYLHKPGHPCQSTTTQDMYVQDICMFMQIEDAIIISPAFLCVCPYIMIICVLKRILRKKSFSFIYKNPQFFFTVCMYVQDICLCKLKTPSSSPMLASLASTPVTREITHQNLGR